MTEIILYSNVMNEPLLVAPDAIAELSAAVSSAAHARGGYSAGTAENDSAPPYKLDGSIATIAVHSALVNRGAARGVQSYSGLRIALAQALRDPQARGIVLDIDSPGGEAAGAVEIADFVREASFTKPVVAYIDSLAASAAYVIAAGATKIVVTPSATVGSIGVVWLHLDQTAALANRGVKPTLIHAGAFKVDGSTLRPLDAGSRTRIQAQLDTVHQLILGSIGGHRPALGARGARETEAGVYMGADAVAARLADQVGDFETARRLALTSRSDPQPQLKRETNMLAHQPAAPAYAASIAAKQSQAEIDAMYAGFALALNATLGPGARLPGEGGMNPFSGRGSGRGDSRAPYDASVPSPAPYRPAPNTSALVTSPQAGQSRAEIDAMYAGFALALNATLGSGARLPGGAFRRG